jgi:hypothetical protein
MADKTETVALNKGAGSADETVSQAWVDLGDGTYAPKSVATLNAEEVTVLSPSVTAGAQFCGQKTVATPGTAERLSATSIPLKNGVWVKALAANADIAYVWYATGDGRTGFELSAKEVILVPVADVQDAWIDVAAGGEGVCWMKA